MTVQPRFRTPTKPAPDHIDYVRSLRCCRCWSPPPNVAHHVRIGHQGGTSKKPPDDCTVPLCALCHKELHDRGEATFWIDAFATNRELRNEMVLSFAHSHKRTP